MKLLVDHWGYIFRMTQEGEYDWEAFQAPKETEGNQRRNMENWMRKKSEYRIPSWEPTYPTYGPWKRKTIIFPATFKWDMLVPWSVHEP